MPEELPEGPCEGTLAGAGQSSDPNETLTALRASCHAEQGIVFHASKPEGSGWNFGVELEVVFALLRPIPNGGLPDCAVLSSPPLPLDSPNAAGSGVHRVAEGTEGSAPSARTALFGRRHTFGGCPTGCVRW